MTSLILQAYAEAVWCSPCPAQLGNLVLQAMVKKRTIPFVFHPELKTRFGILPRTAKDQQGIRWFEAPAMMMFHVAAAWEEGSLIKLYVCAWDKVGSCLKLHVQQGSYCAAAAAPAIHACSLAHRTGCWPVSSPPLSELARKFNS